MSYQCIRRNMLHRNLPITFQLLGLAVRRYKHLLHLLFFELLHLLGSFLKSLTQFVAHLGLADQLGLHLHASSWFQQRKVGIVHICS